MPHQLTNLDILNLASFPEYDFIWTDPPWGQPMVKLFETMMAKKGFEKPGNNINDILHHFAALATTGKPVFVEYAIKDTSKVIDIMQLHGHQHTQTLLCQTPQISFNIISFNTAITLTGKYVGFRNVQDAIEQLHPTTIYDPFAGIGKIASFIAKQGVVFFGNEINPYRFSKLKTALCKF